MNASEEATISIWLKQAREDREWPLVDAPPLGEDATCDVVVVGGGIAGVSIAYELAEEGRSVLLLDRGEIGGGMTARTTAHLAPVCDDLLSALIDMRGKDTARLFQESQQAAVDRIEALVKRHGIECGFRRLDGYLFPELGTPAKDAAEQIQTELDAARTTGVEVERVRGVPLEGLSQVPALRYPHQAAFHPLRYLRGLARAAAALGVRFHGHTPVASVEEKDGAATVLTERGQRVTAAAAIVATNSPINDTVAMHSKMAPYRTFAMAFDLGKASLPDALYWDMADPYHYVRLQPAPNDGFWLIAGGEDHKSGEADDGAERFGRLEEWIRKLVPDLGPETARWSGQVLDTIDYCGFIGLDPGNERIWIATGDSGQGMTHGVVASLLLRQLVTGRECPWAELYEPSRKPLPAAKNYLSENMTAVKNFAEYVTGGEIDSAEALKPGEGGILREGLKKLAASRDAGGTLHVRSASCTHLGCIVHWNTTEQCWDCPCHGSQFAPDGSVLNGPATTPLGAPD